MRKYTSVKIQYKNLQDLRLIHTTTGEPILKILDRLISPEADERLRELAQARQAERVAKLPIEK